MKILLLIDSLGSGGAQRQLLELGKGFVLYKHDVSFLTYHPIDFFAEELQSFNISLTCLQEVNLLKRVFRIRSFIRRGDYDVVLSFLETPNLLNVLSGLPFHKWKIITGERSADYGILTSRKRKTLRFFHLFADKVVANSQANMQMVRKANPLLVSSKCAVIYNSVDFNKWRPVEKHKFVQNAKLRIVVAASHSPIKNADGLINALYFLPESEKERIQIDWFGDEKGFDSYPKSIALRDEYALTETVRFFPATNRIRDKYAESDVVGLFSHFEGFPNVICEGMAMAKPVLAPAVSDLPLILGEDYPLFFNPGDIKSITAALQRALAMSPSERIQLGLQNYEKSRYYFDKQQICREYLNIMEQA